MPAVLKLNRLTYPGTTTFFIIDCGQRMCLDNLPRKLKSRCTPLQNKLLGIRKFARCISSHKKLDLSIYAQIGGTITPKPWRKQKFLNNCWHVLEQKIRMRGDAGQNTSNTIYRNFDISKCRKFNNSIYRNFRYKLSIRYIETLDTISNANRHAFDRDVLGSEIL